MRLNAKKKLSLLLAIVMLVGALSGCGGNNTANNNQGSNNNQPSNNGDEGGDTNPAVSGGKDVSTTAERDPNRPIKDTLTIALYEEPNSLDPQGSTLSGNSQVYRIFMTACLFRMRRARFTPTWPPPMSRWTI